MAKRTWRTDRRLWALFALAIFVPLCFVNLLGNQTKGESSLWSYLLRLGNENSNVLALFAMIVVQGLLLAAPAMVVGWSLQAIAVMCGIRLTGQTDEQQVADVEEIKSAERTVGADPCLESR